MIKKQVLFLEEREIENRSKRRLNQDKSTPFADLVKHKKYTKIRVRRRMKSKIKKKKSKPVNKKEVDRQEKAR